MYLTFFRLIMSLNSLLYRSCSYLIFYLKADTIFHIHSPFLYRFIEQIIDSDNTYYFFGKGNYIRNQLLHDKSVLEHIDFGAKGSPEGKRSLKKVREFASTSLSPDWKSELLFRLVACLKPKRILELGTNLGLNAMYLKSAGGESCEMHTIEGSPGLAQFSRTLFNKFRFDIHLHEGRFDVILPEILERSPGFDLYYLDGNHTYEGTKECFELIKVYLHEKSVIVIDDIHWSQEMKRAWDEISGDTSVRLSVDLYQLGILFFRKDFKSKVYQRVLPCNLKPWQKYLPG